MSNASASPEITQENPSAPPSALQKVKRGKKILSFYIFAIQHAYIKSECDNDLSFAKCVRNERASRCTLLASCTYKN